MGLQSVPGYVGAVGYQHPALLDRAILKSRAGSKPGVFDELDFVVSPTAGLNVSITPGAALLQGKDTTNQGHYYVWSDATEVVPAVPPAASNRIDALVLRAVDPTYSAGPTPGAVWHFVQGTPGSGVAPTDADIIAGGNYRPGGWIRIADVQINVADTTVDPSRIFDKRMWTTNANGLIYCRNSSARPTSDLEKGDRIWQLDTGRKYYYDGAAWVFDGNPLWAKLAADATAKTSNTTFSNITGFAFDLEANATYRVELAIVYTATGNGRLKMGSTFPSGMTGQINFGGPITSTAAGDLFWSSLKIPQTNLADWGVVGGVGTGTQIIAKVEGWITTTNPGTWQLQYAQGTSHADTTQVRAGTHGRVERMV